MMNNTNTNERTVGECEAFWAQYPALVESAREFFLTSYGAWDHISDADIRAFNATTIMSMIEHWAGGVDAFARSVRR